MIEFAVSVVPPKTTSQQKRATWRAGALRFFKSERQESAEHVMMTLLRPHRPAAPVDGPLDLAIAFTWPHLTSTRRADRARHLPKATRPDADNIAKAAIDCLVKLQFMRDDGQVARLTVEKFHGPAELVGIRIKLAPMVAF